MRRLIRIASVVEVAFFMLGLFILLLIAPKVAWSYLLPQEEEALAA